MIHPETPPRAALARQLSMPIAALVKPWQEELGGPEAPATVLVPQKPQRLLTRITGDKAPERADGMRLADYLGHDWIEATPWAATHINRIDSGLRGGNRPHAAWSHSPRSSPLFLHLNDNGSS